MFGFFVLGRSDWTRTSEARRRRIPFVRRSTGSLLQKGSLGGLTTRKQPNPPGCFRLPTLGPEAVRKDAEPFHKRPFDAFQSSFRAKPRGQSAFVSTHSMRCFSRMGQIMGQIFAMQIKAILKCPLSQMNGSTFASLRYGIWIGYRRTNKREKVYKSRLAPHLI